MGSKLPWSYWQSFIVLIPTQSATYCRSRFVGTVLSLPSINLGCTKIWHASQIYLNSTKTEWVQARYTWITSKMLSVGIGAISLCNQQLFWCCWTPHHRTAQLQTNSPFLPRSNYTANPELNKICRRQSNYRVSSLILDKCSSQTSKNDLYCFFMWWTTQTMTVPTRSAHHPWALWRGRGGQGTWYIHQGLTVWQPICAHLNS